MIVRTSILALMVLAGAVSAADEDRIEWTTWTSAEGKCEIMFPGKPKEMAGKDYALATFETMKDRVMYLVRAQTMSPAVPIDREALVGKVMDMSRDALLKTLKDGKLTSETKSLFDKKYPAREIVVEVPPMRVYRVRFVMTPTRFYQLTLSGPKEVVDSAEGTKFFESFALKK
jgi:hypothetical protein